MKWKLWLRDCVLPYWKTLVVVLVPILLLPLPLLAAYDGPDDGRPHKEAVTGYVILIMAFYWMTEALPLPVTSLLPVAAFPALGVIDTATASAAFMKESTMMYMGGLIVALSVEYCNLHLRIALKVLILVGSSPRRLMAGFMLVTAFLSMWISNTATTAIMAPIVEAVVRQLYQDADGDADADVDAGADADATPMRRVRVGILLSVAYASNIGGTASIIGSGPQLAFKGIFNDVFPEQNVMNFATWMGFNVPGMIVNVFVAWIWLQYLFIGFTETTDVEAEKEVGRLIRRKYRDLGPMTFHEGAVLVLFVVLVLVWFFRDPQFIPGWSEFIPGAEVDDSTPVMAVVILMFVLPSRLDFWCFRSRSETGAEEPVEALLNWSYVQRRMDWGIVILLGGGFALSDASLQSGLSDWLGQQLSVLRVLPPFVIMLIICVMTAAVTEVASNTATANIVLPILAQMAQIIEINPLYLMLPATVSCSYAFMLPVATAPNAIVFSVAKMKPMDMIWPGILMNFVCILVLCFMMEFYGNALFDLYTFPEWARPVNATATVRPCLS